MTRARDRSPRQQSSSLTKRSDSRLLAFSFETSCWEWGRGGGGVAADDAEGGGRAHGGVARQPQVRPAQRAVPPRPPWGSVSGLVFSAVCVSFFPAWDFLHLHCGQEVLGMMDCALLLLWALIVLWQRGRLWPELSPNASENSLHFFISVLV